MRTDTTDAQTTQEIRPTSDAALAAEYERQWKADAIVRCECSAITGERCEWTGPQSQTVIVEHIVAVRFCDIPQFTRSASYAIDVPWRVFESWLSQQIENKDGLCVLDLNPDFQRGYVWVQPQKVAYVEYILRGGCSGRDLYFNCTGWNRDYKGPYVIVDGKQRLEAVRGFLAGRVLAFGARFDEYEDGLLWNTSFKVHVNDLDSRAAVLRWYLEMNTGGTVHTRDELAKERHREAESRQQDEAERDAASARDVRAGRSGSRSDRKEAPCTCLQTARRAAGALRRAHR